MSRAKTKKQITSKITSKVEKQVVELSLNNPDFGARRLVPLLMKEKISVSSSQIYNILKRNDLQNRQKRLARIKERISESKVNPRKAPVHITEEVAERIIQISLQNPNYGVRRLMPLMQKEKISASTTAVYNVLKRNGIQTREKRLARIQTQYPVEGLPPQDTEMPAPQVVEIPSQPTVAISTPAEQLKLVSEIIEEKPSSHRFVPVSKAPKKIKARRPWFLTLLNSLLFLLLLLLGFYTWQNVHTAMLEPQSVAAINDQSKSTTVEPQIAALPLNDYRIISERNLFNVSKQKAPAPKKEIAIDKLALAKEDLGLKLVGTVVADDPRLSRAFIDNSNTREQEIYREGDEANEVLIKKVLRNKVVITTEEGDKLLNVEIEQSTKGSKTSPFGLQLPGSPAASSRIPGSTLTPARSASINLNREEVEASLADTGQLLEELSISPHMQADQPSGFMISRVPPQSVLRKMGLRSRDVIVGVNDEDITSPGQAPQFFQTLAEGGEVTIKIKRRRRSRQIKLSIE